MIYIAYGNDTAKNTFDILAASDIGDYLRASDKVAIKPNLVVSRPASDGAMTHPEVVECVPGCPPKSTDIIEVLR